MSRLRREIEKEQGKHWVDLTPESASSWHLSQLCQLVTSESQRKIRSSILILEDFKKTLTVIIRRASTR